MKAVDMIGMVVRRKQAPGVKHARGIVLRAEGFGHQATGTTSGWPDYGFVVELQPLHTVFNPTLEGWEPVPDHELTAVERVRALTVAWPFHENFMDEESSCHADYGDYAWRALVACLTPEAEQEIVWDDEWPDIETLVMAVARELDHLRITKAPLV